ncbi:HK97 family phage prohead protease [Kribbella sp. NPDC059898]|uniref:HK97 family phage prohead protease n=1 Tax=Kribbella sp. NPDC059898 TaxID=3346995 RepID=UPI00364E9A46
MPELKTLPARVKAANTTDDGVVEALVATYDVDSIGDRILPGAFSKSLQEWADSGNTIPFIWSHLHDDLDAYIGEVTEAKETDEGLWVKAQIDMEDPKAAKAFKLIKGGRVRQYSFAYDVPDGGAAPDEEGPGETALKELNLYEVGPTLIGMNQNTRTLVAKRNEGAGGKAGRVLSAKNETDLRDAMNLISGVLKQLDSTSSDTSQEKTSDAGPTTAKEPEGATAKESSRATSVTTLAAEFDLIELEGGV